MTISIAQDIIESFGSKSSDIFNSCEGLAETIEQDFEQEKTTYIFIDESKIEMINDECKVI